MRRAFPLLLAGALAACGGGQASRPPGAAAPGAAVSVTAAVLKRRGAAPRACLAILTSWPPAGCSGVRVEGYDFGRVSGTTRFAGGWLTPALRLSGAWDGRVLRVRAVRPAPGARPAPSSPGRCTVAPTPRGRRLARRIEPGVRAAQPLAFGPCGRTAWMLVPYADGDVIAAVHDRYGPDVIVIGWLAGRGA